MEIMKTNNVEGHTICALILIVGIIVGNRIYNHYSAWLGISIIVGCILFTIYKSINHLKKNENKK